jgi:hypothetical protein
MNVFDHLQIVFAGDLHDRIHIAGVSRQMDDTIALVRGVMRDSIDPGSML